jgi:hypothetical protein
MTFSVRITVRGYELDTQGHPGGHLRALADNPAVFGLEDAPVG